MVKVIPVLIVIGIWSLKEGVKVIPVLSDRDLELKWHTCNSGFIVIGIGIGS